MKTLVKYFIFLSLGIFSSCMGQVESLPYGKYVSEIIHSFAQDMKNEYGLVCVGSGGRMPRNVETIAMHFHAYRRSSIEETRELMVTIRKELADKVNAHEKIRPYLKTYPFTWREADITIAFHKPHSNSYYLDGSVALACSADLGKKISYSKMELQMSKYPDFVDLEGNVKIGKTIEEETFVDLLTESYEEALAVVNTSKKNENSR